MNGSQRQASASQADTRTTYLSVQDMVQLVQRLGLPAFIAGVAQRIEADFLRWPSFDKTPRVAAHSRDGVIELMPIADAVNFAFKYVNGHPLNIRHGLPTVMAFGLLADVATGVPRLLSELTLTTAVRTAAMSAVAARALARPGSRRMAPAVAGILERAGLSLDDIDGYALHPGGAKVIHALDAEYRGERYRQLNREFHTLIHRMGRSEALHRRLAASWAMSGRPVSGICSGRSFWAR